VEPEVHIAPASIPEAVITPPEIPPSTNSETVVIEDDDGLDSVVPSEQPATGEPVTRASRVHKEAKLFRRKLDHGQETD